MVGKRLSYSHGHTTSQLAGCQNVACAVTATATSPGTASGIGLRSRRRRVPTCHGTLLVVTLRRPRRHTTVHRARMGPRKGPWGAPTAPAADAAAVGVSRRETSVGGHLPTTLLLLLLHIASLSQTRWHWRCVRARDLLHGSSSSTRCWRSLPPRWS